MICYVSGLRFDSFDNFTTSQPFICFWEKESLHSLTCIIFTKTSTSIFKFKKEFQRDVCVFFYEAIEEWSTPINICMAYMWLPKTLTWNKVC